MKQRIALMSIASRRTMLVLAGLFLLLALAPRRAHAGCSASLEQLRVEVTAGEQAFALLDLPGFLRHFERLQERLPRVCDVFSADDVVDVHVMFAMQAVIENEPQKMLRAFLGAIAARPDFVPSEELMPLGSPMRTQWERALNEPAGVGGRELPRRSGWFFVTDGQLSASRLPLGRNVLVQRFQRLQDGKVQGLQSWYILAGQLPYDVLRLPVERSSVVAQGPPVVSLQPKPAGRRSRGLALSGGLALGLGVGACVAAGQIKRRYRQESPVDAQDLDGQALLRWNRALGLSGITLGVGAAGLGLSALVVGEW